MLLPSLYEDVADASFFFSFLYIWQGVLVHKLVRPSKHVEIFQQKDHTGLIRPVKYPIRVIKTITHFTMINL